MDYTRVRVQGHWVDFPDTTYGVVSGAGLEQWDQALYELKLQAVSVRDSLYGATGDGVTDDSEAIQDAIDSVTSAGGGIVYFPAGTYIVNASLTLPVNTPIILQGAGMGYVGGAAGTLIKRQFGFNAEIIYAVGTGTGATQRIHLHVSQIGFDGNAGNAPVVRISRANECILDRVRIAHTAQEALVSTQLWNSQARDCFFGPTCGGSTTYPVVRLDAPAGESAGNSIHFSNCEWEGNNGVELKISGTVDDALAVNFTNCKWERSGTSDTTSPLIDLYQCSGSNFASCWLHKGATDTGPLIIQKGLSVSPLRANTFSGVTLSHTGTPQYYVDHTVGALSFANVAINGTPSTTYFHVGSSVGAKDFKLSNVMGATRSRLLTDDRTASTYGYGTVQVPPYLVGVTATDSVDQGVFLLPDAATTSYEGQAALPADAASGRPVKIRVWWYSAATSGNARIQVSTAASLAAGDSIATSSTVLLATVATPASANTLACSVFQGTDNCDPGEMMRCKVTRLGNDAADTLTTQMRLYALEILYEREL